MTDKPNPYASEAETQALLVPDTCMKAERKLAKMMAERGADEQGAEAYLILRQIAVELLAEQPAPAQHEPVACSICNGSGHIAFDDLTRRSKNDHKWGRCLHCQPYASPQPAQQQEPTDEQIDAAVKAWFENTIVAGRRPFARRMRAAIKAANGIKDTP